MHHLCWHPLLLFPHLYYFWSYAWIPREANFPCRLYTLFEHSIKGKFPRFLERKYFQKQFFCKLLLEIFFKYVFARTSLLILWANVLRRICPEYSELKFQNWRLHSVCNVLRNILQQQSRSNRWRKLLIKEEHLPCAISCVLVMSFGGSTQRARIYGSKNSDLNLRFPLLTLNKEHKLKMIQNQLLSTTRGLKQDKSGKERGTSVRKIKCFLPIPVPCHERQQSLENIMGWER